MNIVWKTSDRISESQYLSKAAYALTNSRVPSSEYHHVYLSHLRNPPPAGRMVIMVEAVGEIN